jgi:hypothetical protein
LQELEGADLAGGGDVRALAQVLELGLPVEGHLLVPGGFVLQDLALERVVLVVLLDLVAGPREPLEVVVLVDDGGHLVLDLVEVVAVEVDAGDVIVEAVVGPGADRELGVVVQPEQSLRKHVRGRVSKRVQVLVVGFGHDAEGPVLVEWLFLGDELPVELASHGVAGQAWPDFSGHVVDCGALGHLHGGAVGEFDLDRHVDHLNAKLRPGSTGRMAGRTLGLVKVTGSRALAGPKDPAPASHRVLCTKGDGAVKSDDVRLRGVPQRRLRARGRGPDQRLRPRVPLRGRLLRGDPGLRRHDLQARRASGPTL